MVVIQSNSRVIKTLIIGLLLMGLSACDVGGPRLSGVSQGHPDERLGLPIRIASKSLDQHQETLSRNRSSKAFQALAQRYCGQLNFAALGLQGHRFPPGCTGRAKAQRDFAWGQARFCRRLTPSALLQEVSRTGRHREECRFSAAQRAAVQRGYMNYCGRMDLRAFAQRNLALPQGCRRSAVQLTRYQQGRALQRLR